MPEVRVGRGGSVLLCAQHVDAVLRLLTDAWPVDSTEDGCDLCGVGLSIEGFVEAVRWGARVGEAVLPAGPIRLLFRGRDDHLWEIPRADFVALFVRSRFAQFEGRDLRDRLELFVTAPRDNGGLQSELMPGMSIDALLALVDGPDAEISVRTIDQGAEQRAGRPTTR